MNLPPIDADKRRLLRMTSAFIGVDRRHNYLPERLPLFLGTSSGGV